MSLSRSRERLLRRIATRRGREAERAVLLEGPRVLETALHHGAELRFAVVDETFEAAAPQGTSPPWLDRLAEARVEVVRVPTETVLALSDTDSPQGVLAVAAEPRVPATPPPSVLRVLVLDALQDPGNAGTLLRVAAAFGVRHVVALDGTVDLWNPKVVRASAGYGFALGLHSARWEETLAWLREAELPLVVGEAGGRDPREWMQERPSRNEPGSSEEGDAPQVAERWALLVGNEGAGPRREAQAAADARLGIPMSEGVDSLNVAIAGSILLWALGPARDLPARTSP